ncbi:MAG: hypothetical protein KA366_02940 [Hydromonas sp.]|nr:hypothetical protein [Hydromonas sp.]MBP6294662.1 hypothetical protein [Hydromonas sp.]
MSKFVAVLTLSMCVCVSLLGCNDSKQSATNTQELKQSAQYQLNTDCAPLIKTLDSCPANRLPKQSQEHMMAILEEQMRALPVSEASKKCQELQDFWKVACGVTVAQ